MTGTARIDTQGSLTTTNNSLDLAIEGSGYFQVEMPDGTIGYTRAGNFSLSSEGVVVTSDGLPLQPQIQVPEGASSLTIEIGRAHVCTPVTNAQLVCRLLLEKKYKQHTHTD